MLDRNRLTLERLSKGCKSPKYLLKGDGLLLIFESLSPEESWQNSERSNHVKQLEESCRRTRCLKKSNGELDSCSYATQASLQATIRRHSLKGAANLPSKLQLLLLVSLSFIFTVSQSGKLKSPVSVSCRSEEILALSLNWLDVFGAVRGIISHRALLRVVKNYR